MAVINLHNTDKQVERLFLALVEALEENSAELSLASTIGVIEMLKLSTIEAQRD